MTRHLHTPRSDPQPSGAARMERTCPREVPGEERDALSVAKAQRREVPR